MKPYVSVRRTDTNNASNNLSSSSRQFQTTMSSSEQCSHAAFHSVSSIQANFSLPASQPSSISSNICQGTENSSFVSKGPNYSVTSCSRVASLDEKTFVPFRSGVSVSCVRGTEQKSYVACVAGSQQSLLNSGRLNDSVATGRNDSGSVQCSGPGIEAVVITGGESSASSNAAGDAEKKKMARQYHLLQG